MGVEFQREQVDRNQQRFVYVMQLPLGAGSWAVMPRGVEENASYTVVARAPMGEGKRRKNIE